MILLQNKDKYIWNYQIRIHLRSLAGNPYKQLQFHLITKIIEHRDTMNNLMRMATLKKKNTKYSQLDKASLWSGILV